MWMMSAQADDVASTLQATALVRVGGGLQTRMMEFAGVLPPDAPDPFARAEEWVRALPFPVWGFVPQRSLEDDRRPGHATVGGSTGPGRIEVSLGYTVWHNPDDHDDPVNLAELDDRTRAALDEVPPWPRPDWLIQAVDKMRYPRLSEAVRTTWRRDPAPGDLVDEIVHHSNHILMNRFREELGLPIGSTEETGWQVKPTAVNTAASVMVDGTRMPSVEIDTDPFVFAIGVRIADDLVVTAVIPREFLPMLDLALARRL